MQCILVHIPDNLSFLKIGTPDLKGNFQMAYQYIADWRRARPNHCRRYMHGIFALHSAMPELDQMPG